MKKHTFARYTKLKKRTSLSEKMKQHPLLLRLCLIVLVCGIVAGVFWAGVNWYMSDSVSDRILTPEEAASLDADCILVLGAGLRKDNSPSPILRERIDRGILLYNAGAAPKLLMSGDHGRVEYNEVGVMKALAVEAGIPSEDVFMDHAGFSTYESLYRARDIFCAKRVIIVSQKYHLYRALYIAEQLGLDAYGVGADVHHFYGKTTREMRESLARLKDFLYCAVQPDPTYLGETIPVSGNGDMTND